MAELGDRVQDRINGFIGIVTGKADYLYGCRQVLVAPETLPQDGKHPDSQWLDEDRVKVTKRAAATRPESAVERGGGPITGPLPSRR